MRAPSAARAPRDLKHYPLLGAVASGLKFQEARRGKIVTRRTRRRQVAAAEASTRKARSAAQHIAAGSIHRWHLGGYGKTNEGKIIAAALLDNFNKIVEVIRSDTSLQRDVGSLRDEAGRRIVAGAVFNEGDIVTSKIANVEAAGPPWRGGEAHRTLA